MEPVTTGERIRAARKAKGLTLKGLADKVGCTEGSIRHYETGRREVADEALHQIAHALDVSYESLLEYRLDSVRDAMQVLFRLEEYGFGAAPNAKGEPLGITFDRKAEHAPKMAMALEAWRAKLDELAAGKITQAEYETWKSQYGK